MTEEVQLVSTDAIVERAEADPEERVITARLLTYGEISGLTNEGFRERVLPGAFSKVDINKVTLEGGAHGASLVGRGIAMRDDGKTVEADFKVSETPAGNDFLTLVRDGVYRDASIVFAPDSRSSTTSKSGVVTRSSIDLRRVAILERGAYASANVLSVREEAQEDTGAEEETAMADIQITNDYDGLAQRVAALETISATPAQEQEAARTLSIGEVVRLGYAGDELANRSLASNIYATDNVALDGRATIKDVKGIVAASRPSVEAFGVRSAGDAGTTVTFPRFSGTIGSAYVGAQSNEFDSVTSVKVTTTLVTANLATYAGGGAISKQLIDRSDPAFMDAWSRIMFASWSKVTEAAFTTALASGYSGSDSLTLSSDTNAASFIGKLYSASMAIEDATGTPATIIIAGDTAFSTLATKLPNAAGGPSNANGVSDLKSLSLWIGGVRVIRASSLNANHVFISNETSAGWHEVPVKVVSADDAEHLASNQAIYSLGTAAIYIPAGVRRIVTG